MDLGKVGIGTFLSSALVELSFPGKLSTFLGLIFLFWGLVSSSTSFTLFGVALLFLALAGYYWGHRYIGVHLAEEWDSPQEKPRWYQQIIWRNFLRGVGFFIAFVVTLYLWLRLPTASLFFQSMGISY